MKNPSAKKTGSAVRDIKKLESASLKKIKGGNIKGGSKHSLTGVSTKPIS